MTQPPARKAPKTLPPPTTWERNKNRVYALILIAVLAAGTTLSIAAFNKAFIPSIEVIVQADRAGLQMHENNKVKIRGVDLGRVEDVRLTDRQDRVQVVLALDPELARQVPTNATVSLEQLTAFGSKAVQFNYPAQPSGQFLDEGSVIEATHVSTEINGTFDQLTTLLSQIPPSKLNATAGALAESLKGQGDSVGATISKANNYLKKLNTDLPALQRDWRAAAGFSHVYADAAPDIVDLVRNLGVTSATVADSETDLPGLLRNLRGLGGEIDSFFDENADPLTDMLASLRPTTSLLKEYSPALTCFLDGAGHTYDLLNTRLAHEGGAEFEVNGVLGGEPYQYPRDLPSTDPGSQRGPNCRGLPVVTPEEDSLSDYSIGPRRFNQDKPDNSPRVAQQPAVVSMFGPEAISPKGGK